MTSQEISMQISFVIATNAKKAPQTRIEIASIKKSIEEAGCKGQIIVSGVVEPFKGIDGIELVDCAEDANNGMLAKIRNLGAEVAKGDIVVFVDDDFLFPHMWVYRMLEYDSKIPWEVMSCRVLLPDGARFWDRALIRPHLMVSYDHPPHDADLYITGGFWVMKMSTYLDNKWNDELPIYATKKGFVENEDVDLSNRVKEKGIALDFDKHNYVWHWDYGYKQNGKVISRYSGTPISSDAFREDLGKIVR